MFLTKKTVNPTKGKNVIKRKPLGGWEDEDESPEYKEAPSPTISQSQSKSVNLLENTHVPVETKTTFSPSKPQRESGDTKVYGYENWDSLNERGDMDCEKYLIENLVQPGGIRVKPSDSMLSEFMKEIRGMEVSNIGSLLLSKLEVNYSFQVKAKTLYIIEYLLKREKEQHSCKIKEFPEPDENPENYRKLQKTILNQLGSQVEQGEVGQPKQVFVDPGYYQEAPKTQIGSFLEENTGKVKKNEGKKPIIGPGQAKTKLLDKKEHFTTKGSESTSNPLLQAKETPTISTGLDNLLQLGTALPNDLPNNDLLL